jgi:hypothetical protein
MLVERLDDPRRVDARGPVVESEDDLAVGKEVAFLVLLMAEARTAGSIDLDRPAETKRLGPVMQTDAGGRAAGQVPAAAITASAAPTAGVTSYSNRATGHQPTHDVNSIAYEIAIRWQARHYDTFCGGMRCRRHAQWRRADTGPVAVFFYSRRR